MRTPPNTPPPDVKKRKDDELITETRRYKLITPLFGGGVTPGEADPITVVRATEVRGHLRFWWRATRGGQFNGDLSAMKAAEEQIWGSAAAQGKPGPSDISLNISDARQGTEIQRVEIRTKHGSQQVYVGDVMSPYSYVAFPLRPEQGKPAGKVRDGVEFTLTLMYSANHAEDIAAAIWAWETFGGIGARTRRGFGALECVGVNGVSPIQPLAGNALGEIQTKLNMYTVKGTWPPGVPHLVRGMKVVPPGGRSSADDAWRYLFDRLKRFRQARFPDSNGRPFGRSKWPEPDAIRNVTGDSATKHAKRRLAFDKFPRAAFGLPMIFQFKDANIGDPSQTSLEGAEHDRLASPLILRPLACADGTYIGLAAVLYAPTLPPNGLRLKGVPGNPSVLARLTQSEARQIEPLNGNTDILQAFLESL